MSRGMWETVETKAGKVRMTEAERERRERRGGKEMRRKRETKV